MVEKISFVFLCGYDHLCGGEFGQQILDDRIDEILKVIKDRNPEFVVISGAHPDGVHHSYPYSRKRLLEGGIPEDKIIMETKGSNTFTSFRCFFEDHPEFTGGRGIIVTSAQHIPRTSLYLEKVLNSLRLYGKFVMEYTGPDVPNREEFRSHERKEIGSFVDTHWDGK